MTMLTTVVAIFLLIVTVTYGRVLLYNTENSQAVEKFDCVYYTYDDGEEISYCRRPGGNQTIDRRQIECENQGEKKIFRDLLDQDIKPSDVLSWSSSVEMADMYARFFYNRSSSMDDDQFLCNCTKRGTFGKYCEYQLTHDAESFSEAINAQFETKRNGDSWNTQRYGKILCYATLVCDSGPLCLDWREISDGTQRCSSGVDEENWDMLEFNECEDNAFRCTNGMCIPEEFWLDGHVDCMDWSDELLHGFGQSCPFTPNAMECDEHVCSRNSYSCGDGQCVEWITRMAFQRFTRADNDCFNKRNLNYMCEVSPHQPAWTLQDGLCWPDEGYDDPRYPPRSMMNASQLTAGEKCEYLWRCILSHDFESDCPCNQLNCTQIMTSVCPQSLILYPPPGLINPNVLFYYNYDRSTENPSVDSMFLHGSLRCRGYQFTINQLIAIPFSLAVIVNSRINNIICTLTHTNGYKNDSSSLQYDKFCWNESLTFNGRPYAVNPDICTNTGECLSQYRIHDGFTDCLYAEDEDGVLDKDYCTGNIGRHRFKCFNDQHKCLPLLRLGTGTTECSNNYDERWYGFGLPLRQSIKCQKSDTSDCDRLKEYIGQSSVKNTSSLINPHPQTLNDSIAFRSYCDSFWDLRKHDDEQVFSCQHWVCREDQYQCLTGQCIELDWVCDGEWDCPDASDEESVVLIQHWSSHNVRLEGLENQREKCRRRYSQSPFSKICNSSFEFGCYRSRVSNPLDIESNRPCINLTQIGDGLDDCYNAYDEKNTFATNSDNGDMWGYHLRCENHNEPYPSACQLEAKSNCSKILCSSYRDANGSCSGNKDFICLGDNRCVKNARCNGIFDCLHGEDEYWCPSGSIHDQLYYRIDKKTRYRPHSILLPEFPHQNVMETRQLQLSKAIVNPLNDDHLFIVHSYQCNRGVAILQNNATVCLCPPAYYGRWCEFFRDRISVTAHVDQKTLLTKTLKIKANFLFNDTIIDDHEFTINPTIESWTKTKHRFYLLYSRSAQMLAHKQNRYFNRTDVIKNHPYSVHFEVFSLENDNSVNELGSWRYPIYFDYLPAYRLALVLKFPAWFSDNRADPCSQNICNGNSTCLPIFNQNNSYYCSCKSGYFGKDCQMYEPHCETYCPGNALCRSNAHHLHSSTNKSNCICPLNRFGSRCDLKYDGCASNPCLNNGTCFPTDDQSGEVPYRCLCSKRFYGDRCQSEKPSVRVDLKMANASSVHATVVQFYDFEMSSLQLLLQQQQVYHSLPSTIRYDGYHLDAPVLGLLKIYEGLTNPRYFIMYILSKKSMINITSSPEHCPHASSLLPEGNQSVSAVFWYHQICRDNIQPLCFYDENYLCICQLNHYRAECLGHDTQLDHCQNCLSGGTCLQGDQEDPNDFICLCPSSHHGRRCEFSSESFNTTIPQPSSTATVSRPNAGSKEVKIGCVSITILLFSIGFSNHFSLIGHI